MKGLPDLIDDLIYLKKRYECWHCVRIKRILSNMYVKKIIKNKFISLQTTLGIVQSCGFKFHVANVNIATIIRHDDVMIKNKIAERNSFSNSNLNVIYHHPNATNLFSCFYFYMKICQLL